MCSMPEGENLIEAAIKEVAKKTGKTVEEVLSEAKSEVKKDVEKAAREGRGALLGDQKADLRLLEEAEKNIRGSRSGKKSR